MSVSSDPNACAALIGMSIGAVSAPCPCPDRGRPATMLVPRDRPRGCLATHTPPQREAQRQEVRLGMGYLSPLTGTGHMPDPRTARQCGRFDVADKVGAQYADPMPANPQAPLPRAVALPATAPEPWEADVARELEPRPRGKRAVPGVRSQDEERPFVPGRRVYSVAPGGRHVPAMGGRATAMAANRIGPGFG